MRIAMVTPAYPLRGGIAKLSALLAQNLIARGHTVHLFSFTRQYPELLFPGKTQYVEGPDPHPVPSTALIDVLNPLTWARTAFAVADFVPDLVLFRYWMPFFAPCYASIAGLLRMRRLKVALLVDNALPHEPRPGDAALTKLALWQADAFVTMTGSVRAQLEELRPGLPTTFAHHPIYELKDAGLTKAEARAKLGITRPRCLVFFGLVRHYKGVDILLEALARCDDPELELVVAGEFYLPRSRYEELVRRLGIAERVRFEDRFVPEDEVGAWFAAADAICLPYRHATQSGPAYLAYQFGVPVIASAVGGLAEVVEDGRSGLLAAPEPEAFAAAIRRFYDEELEQPLRAGVVEVRERFGWDPLCAAVVEAAELVQL